MSTNPGRDNILGIHSGALGDVILFARLLGELGGCVTLAGGGEKVRMLEGLGAIGCAIDFDTLPMSEVFTDTPPDQCRLRELLGGHDRLISCFAAGDPAAEARLTALCGAADSTMLPVRPGENFAGHLTDLWRSMLAMPAEAAGSDAPWTVPDRWHDDAIEAIRTRGTEANRRVVLIHPGSGGDDKCWPLERFLELGQLLQQDEMTRAVFTIGPVECERWDAARIEAIATRFALLPSPSLTTLAGAIAVAETFVGNDSGPAHLAAALGKATVAIFGPSRAEHFTPRGRAVVTVSGKYLTAVHAEHVLEAISKAADLASRRGSERFRAEPTTGGKT